MSIRDVFKIVYDPAPLSKQGVLLKQIERNCVWTDINFVVLN